VTATHTNPMQRAAVARGWWALAGVVALALVALAVALLGSVSALGDALGGLGPSGRASGCDGCRAAPEGASVVRGGRVVAPIRQIADPGRGRAHALFLAPAAGPVIDSARAGRLVGRLEPLYHAGAWTVTLLPPDSVVGLRVAAGLVVTPGAPPVPVYGEWVSPP
jgi:hypothetical protein